MDTLSVGHHDRAKTLVCWPDPCCLSPYSLEHWVLHLHVLLDLNPDIVSMCVYSVI